MFHIIVVKHIKILGSGCCYVRRTFGRRKWSPRNLPRSLPRVYRPSGIHPTRALHLLKIRLMLVECFTNLIAFYTRCNYNVFLKLHAGYAGYVHVLVLFVYA